MWRGGAPTLFLLALLAAAGCGDQSTPGPATPTESSETPGTDRPTGQPPKTTKTTVPPSEGKQKIRVVGEITSIGDCVVLRDDNDITWTLTGEKTLQLRVGDRVQVTGAPDLTATGCGGPLVAATTITVVG